MTIPLPEDKPQQVKLQCLGLYQSLQMSNFPIDEDVRTSYVNNQDVVPARLKSGFFQE